MDHKEHDGRGVLRVAAIPMLLDVFVLLGLLFLANLKPWYAAIGLIVLCWSTYWYQQEWIEKGSRFMAAWMLNGIAKVVFVLGPLALWAGYRL